MKIATRLALLQWQANPADPAALWRLIVAWVTPGMREPARMKRVRDTTDQEIPRAQRNAGGSVAVGRWEPRAALLATFGELMEQHPTALMGTCRLPAPKQTMKTVIKEAWQHETELRPHLAQAYLHLSCFQDGIGNAVLDSKLPDIKRRPDRNPDLEAVRQHAIDMTGSEGENFRQWIMWSKVSLGEREILLEEWRTFEDQARNRAC